MSDIKKYPYPQKTAAGQIPCSSQKKNINKDNAAEKDPFSPQNPEEKEKKKEGFILRPAGRW